MKYFVITVLFLLAPFTAQAQTFVSKEQANQYFTHCVQNSAATEQRFSPHAQQMFCACTAARLTQFFSVEDMRTMTDTANPNSRIALNKMIVNVYAPCMDIPMQEYHYAQCMSSPQLAQLTNNPQAMCECASKALGEHMKTYGSRLFEELLSRNATMEDPMDAIYNDPGFQTLAQSKAVACLK